MIRRTILLSALAVFALCPTLSLAQTGNDPDLAAILEPIRVKYHLPALAGAIFTRDGGVEMAAVGVRKAGTEIPVAVNDLWHLGSDTKALTAMLVGTFVAEKKLSWDDKVISYFPEIAEQVSAKIQNVTIDQVLRHEAGLAAANDSRFMAKLSPSGSLIEQRLKVAHMSNILTADQFATYTQYLLNDLHVQKVTQNLIPVQMPPLQFAPARATMTSSLDDQESLKYSLNR